MNYRELWNDENTQIRERYDLAMERIAQIPSEERIAEPFRDYFAVLAHFAGQIEELARLQLREELEGYSLEELKAFNHVL